MNLNKTLFETKNGQRRLKPRVMVGMSVALFGLFALTVFMLARPNARPKQVDSPFANRPSLPRQKLNYDIVQIDTISLGDYLKSQEPAAAPAVTESVVRQPQPRATTTSTRRAPETQAQYPASPRFESIASNPVADRNPNMIVVSSMSGNNPAATSSILGVQSTLVKVTLPEKVSVNNNSLVEARVISETNLGNTSIPRRAKLLGIASLQGNRVYVDFREIKIDGVSRSCSGRAYDLRKQLGLAYSPLQAAQSSAGKAVVDELKSVASGIPVVGRYANQTNTNALTEETARFEEGTEFYVHITSIF